MVVGVTVTRVKPRQVKLQEGLTVPRVLETFLVRIQGRGEGKPPRLSNYANPASPVPVPLLPLVEDEGDAQAAARNFSQLRSLVFASAAFPVAFAPQTIEYCLSKPPPPGEAPTAKTLACSAPEFADLFVDGGVFDNNPLRLAWNVAERRLRLTPDGRAVWAEPFAPAVGLPHPGVRHVYLDPDSTVYPPEDAGQTEASAPARGILSRLSSLGGGIVESARARELLQLAAEKPDVSQRMQLMMANLPKASEHLSAFVGFFEQDFRVFDFYLGMYDAFVELKDTPAWKGTAPEFFEGLLAIDEQARRGWAPFLCVLAVAEPGYEAFRPLCELPELENFRIQLQVSLHRLYDACQPTGQSVAFSVGRYHHHCTQARQGFEAPTVPGVTPLASKVTHRKEGEPSFDYAMRLLGEYGFFFRDLGLTKAQSRKGELAVRRALDDVVEEWATAQPTFTDRTLSKTGARAALNGIEFSPPNYSGYVVLGTIIEAGASAVPFGWEPKWLQATGAFTINYFFSLLTEANPRTTFNLAAGPNFHLSFLSNAVVQPKVALRAGAQLSVLDGFGSKPCAEVTTDPRGCTQGVVDGVIVVSLLERIRFQVAVQTYPGLWGKTANVTNMQFGFGFQFY